MFSFMNLIGMVFKVEKLSRVDTVKGTGLTIILSLKTVPSLFLPMCGAHNSSLDLDALSSLISSKSLGLFAETEFLCFLKIKFHEAKKQITYAILIVIYISLLNSLIICVVSHCLKRALCIQ